ncbi:MAG TPA: 3-dehydroquinate synthase [Bacteroidetes bacterium]|nr:3-dehydroquinate synthase [Bacteroidota bacterium]
MKKYQLNTKTGTSDILICESFEKLQEHTAGKKIVILTDEQIFALQGERFPDVSIIRIPQGEQAKSLGRTTLLYQELVRLGVDRSDMLVAVGGGVICDLGGFVATTFQRGIGLSFVPTTLLAQVDAAIGGKNGVNLGKYKNMVGTFRQPSFVLIDPSFLKTLPENEFISGLAEVVKYGLISDPGILALIEGKTPREISGDHDLLTELIERSVRAKVAVVTQDEEDRGLRRILNFGHTYGHGIERLYELPHGKAVAYGMVVAVDISIQLGLAEDMLRKRIFTLLKNLELLPDIKPDQEKVMELISHDKKKKGKEIPFVLLKDAGKTVIRPLSPDKIMDLLKNIKLFTI